MSATGSLPRPSATEGYTVVVIFVLAWAAALAVWRFGRIEERWTAALRSPRAQAPGSEE